MSPASSLILTPKQHGDIQRLLQDLESHIVARGAALMRDRAVRSLKWSAEDNTVTAQVQGGKLYKTQLEFDELGVTVECTCAYEFDCKHGVAVLLELLKNDALTSNSQPAPAKKRVVKSNLPPPSPDSLAGLVTAKLGAPLGKKERKFLDAVEPWWKKKITSVELVRLYQAFGAPSRWGYATVQLFPSELPPANEWEFFAYLSAAAETVGLAWPEPLAEVVDDSLQKQVLEKWQRLKKVAEWRQALASWKEVEAVVAEESPELRLQMHAEGAVVQYRHPGAAEFGKAVLAMLRALSPSAYGTQTRQVHLSAGSALVLRAISGDYGQIAGLQAKALSASLNRSLAQLISAPELFQRHVVSPQGEPLMIQDEPLHWKLESPNSAEGEYKLTLLNEQGMSPSPPVAILPGSPLRYVTADSVYTLPYWPFAEQQVRWPVSIPAQAMESREGVSALAKLGVEVPPRLAGKVRFVKAEVVVRCALHQYNNSNSDYLRVMGLAKTGPMEGVQYWNSNNWTFSHLPHHQQKYQPIDPENKGSYVQYDRSAMPAAGAWIRQMPLGQIVQEVDGYWLQQRIVARDFPDQFQAWLERRPQDVTVELDAELAALRDGRVSGQLRLDIEESKTGIDWFDLSVAVDVTDHTLTPEEIELLMKAKGKWVRLTGKGWRKLDFQLSEQQVQELAEMGMAAHDFTGEKQRLHALQLGKLTSKGESLMPAERAEQVRRRLEEIQTRVTPDLPSAIQATLRPYQLSGFHFLAYLTANRFGGVLADDMGLGKTLQALTWLAWLRAEQKVKEPFLVVCPKSVQDNWRAEATRFFPELRVEVWNRTTAGKTGLAGEADLLVIHYAQLRAHEETLRVLTWGAAILDEAQAIKNPTSQSARSACALEARHRLALTGTPVENRLMDLWSIFAFAMPGVLGTRASFTRNFDGKEDPLARRRLAARTRPFLLRRTKKEVASDLPDRIEEDLVIELEGTQATLYQAELKRARAQLLKAEVAGQLDKLRFNILTSLLRLRQICCHPRLIGLGDEQGTAPLKRTKKKKDSESDSAGGSVESAKIGALMDLLEPLMEEGQKVLVFSQFVEMLEIIEAEIAEQGWRSFKLTGQTEDRGTLVSQFQEHPGSATFLISLKAGGMGLNLTAASYVVLFDPWWNPAVEAQAIDRTHRIGQKQTVFAYRLLVKDSIEEKIRLLQKQKGALAQDILGEENFAQALTLSDFRFLLGGE